MLPLEHSAILSTFIKLPFVIKICGLSIFEWSLKTGFTVCYAPFSVFMVFDDTRCVHIILALMRLLRNSWKLQLFHRELILKRGTNFFSNSKINEI